MRHLRRLRDELILLDRELASAVRTRDDALESLGLAARIAIRNAERAGPLAALAETIGALEAETEGHEHRRAEFVRTLDSVEAERGEVVGRLDASLEALKERLREPAADKKRFENDREALLKKLAALREPEDEDGDAEPDAARARATEIEAQLSGLSGEIAERSRAMDAIGADIARVEAERTAEVERLDARIAELRVSCAAASERVALTSGRRRAALVDLGRESLALSGVEGVESERKRAGTALQRCDTLQTRYAELRDAQASFDRAAMHRTLALTFGALALVVVAWSVFGSGG